MDYLETSCIISKDFFPALFLFLVSNSTPCDQNPTLHELKICSGPPILANVPYSLKRMQLGVKCFTNVNYIQFVHGVVLFFYNLTDLLFAMTE